MVRISKQSERRSRSPRKHQKHIAKKTGPRVDNLPQGHREHANALGGELAAKAFIPKIK
jgi:hypothetical protein